MIKIQSINEGWFKQPYMSTLKTLKETRIINVNE